MSGSAGRSCWPDWSSRSSCGRRCRTGFRREGHARCCGGRRHSGLSRGRRMSGRWRNTSSWRPSGAWWHSSRARHRAWEDCPWCSRLGSNSRSGWRCRSRGLGRSRSGRRSSRACCWPGLRCLCFGLFFGFRGCFRRRKPQKMLPCEFGVAQVERARMRLLFCDADFRQEIDQDLSLDLKFPCQLVDADLIWI